MPEQRFDHQETPNLQLAREAVSLALAEVRDSNPSPLDLLGEQRVAGLADIACNTLAMDGEELRKQALELDKSDDPTVTRTREVAQALGMPPLSLAYSQAYEASMGSVKSEEVAERVADQNFRDQIAWYRTAIDAAERVLAHEGATLEDAFNSQVQNPPLTFMMDLMTYVHPHLGELRLRAKMDADQSRFNEKMQQLKDVGKPLDNTPEAIQKRSRDAYQEGLDLAHEQHPEVFEGLDENTQSAAENAIIGSVCASREAIAQTADMLDTSSDSLLQAAREGDPNGPDLKAYARAQADQLQNLDFHPRDIERYQEGALYRAVIQRQFRVAYVSFLRGQQGLSNEEALNDPGLVRGTAFIAAVMVGANYNARYSR